MTHTKKLGGFMLIIVLISTLFTGCQKDASTDNTICPFSSLTWESTYEDMTALEGTEYESYDSVYLGKTYTYNKEYLGKTGTVKYMFDDKEHLMCMAWTWGTDSTEELNTVYDTIHKEVVKAHGESGFDNANGTNYGDVWYLESGDILITAVTTESETALQYAYLNPEVSKQE